MTGVDVAANYPGRWCGSSYSHSEHVGYWNGGAHRCAGIGYLAEYERVRAALAVAEQQRDDALAKIASVETLCGADDQRRVPGALHVSRVNAEEIRAALTDPHRGSAE